MGYGGSVLTCGHELQFRSARMVSEHGTRTISPGKAIMRFTSISLGLIGELTSVREKCEIKRNVRNVL